MKLLLILDPINKLNVSYDSSLAMIRTFTKRKHTCWFTDSVDLFMTQNQVQARCRHIQPKANSLRFNVGKQSLLPLHRFDAVLVRKEPPFDMAYIYMTYLLEHAASNVLILNNPRALRDTNEKLSVFDFPNWIPETMVSASADNIVRFQSNLNRAIILKPLDERGGRGLSVLKVSSPAKHKHLQIQSLTRQGRIPIIAQEFLSKPNLTADKRIFFLDGNFLAAYERRFAKGDFRGNLSQGATHHRTSLNQKERKLIKLMRPWLRRRDLHFVGIDLLDGKLLEVNVTCPGGVPEADQLYPGLKVFEKYAESIEKRVRALRDR